MAKGNGSTTDEPAGQPNPLTWDYRYFASDQYPINSPLREATVALERSYNVADAIQGISTILIADDVAQENGEEGMPLTKKLRSQLLLGVHELSTLLISELGQTELRLGSETVMEKGGKRG